MRINQFETQSAESKGPHPDYSLNLAKANEFIANIQKALLPGLGVHVNGTQGLDKSIVAISWSTPKDIYRGNYCYPVSLHQSHQDFCRELEFRFNEYHKAVKEYWESKNVTVLSEPLPETAAKAVSLAPEELMWWDR